MGLGADGFGGRQVVTVAVLRHEPFVSEAAHLFDDRKKTSALLVQLVFDARRRLRIAPADDEVLLLEHAEPLGERPRADAWTGPLQLGEAPGSFGEIVDEDGGPLGADDVRRARNRALLVMDRPHRTHAQIVRHRSKGGERPMGAPRFCWLRAPGEVTHDRRSAEGCQESNESACLHDSSFR
jgi:hypothetical protein